MFTKYYVVQMRTFRAFSWANLPFLVNNLNAGDSKKSSKLGSYERIVE
jgi:hypothetical protein